jgi:Secretion system C-terminal sorting domain
MIKTSKLFLSLFIILFMIAFSASRLIAQDVGIEFTFANPVISNVAGVNYLDFDIMAQATANSQFKIAQLYINYNTAAFGTSIVTSGNVTITKGTGSIIADKLLGIFLSEDYALGQYVIQRSDNTPAILVISNLFSYSTYGTYVGNYGYELSNTLGTTPVRYVHVRIRIQDIGQSSGISFNTSINQWDVQDYYYTTPFTDDQILYAPVIENSTLDLPLPVELTIFTAKASGNEVQLNWETKTEVNNYGFDVEKRVNEGEWNSIGFVEGNGNSNSPKEYSFIDKELFAGGSKFNYRLKQIDTDGSFSYSDEVEVEIVPDEYELSQNYPNPFNPTTTIRFSLPKAAMVSIKIYDILGRFVTEIANADYEAGFHKVVFDASSYPSGVYLYRIESINFNSIKKMLLIK